MAKRVKLSDLAAETGVSTVTVSKALSGKAGVSRELREKIRSLAEEMGYCQPSAIRKAKPRKNYNIGVLIAQKYLGKYDSFYWQIYQEITRKASEKECFTMLEVVESKEEMEPSLPKIVQEQKVDSLILIGGMDEKYLKLLCEKEGIPILFLDYYNKEAGCDAIISNSYFGSCELTSYLIHLGHTQIAFVGTLLATRSITDRYFGFCKGMLEKGLEVRKDWVIQDRDIQEGVIDPEHFIELPQEMPTAFVCNCDLTANYLIRKLRQQGIRVPEDVSVTGFDNYLMPELSEVRITTYEVDTRVMAGKAVHDIIRKMEDPDYHTGVYIAEGRLIRRESTARR